MNLKSLEAKGCPGERRNASGSAWAVRSPVVHRRQASAGFHVSGGPVFQPSWTTPIASCVPR